jgi:FtsP/CotA-like multicopper oxidase with cupredoxin domain
MMTLTWVGFTQCPIAPGKTFTYRSKAELYGTSWWHSHFSAQYADGVFGPLIVYGPYGDYDYDVDLGPVLLNEHHHADYVSIVKEITSPHPEPPPPAPISDNNLINGKGVSDCNAANAGPNCEKAGPATFRFKSGKKHRLRLINSGADASQQFSIDGHVMTVIENDYVPIEPYNTTVVTLGVGQRTDVIVQAVGAPNSAYWMRSNITCFETRQPNALAAIYYESADLKTLPTSQALPNLTPGCANDPLEKTIPSYPITPGNPDVTVTLNMTIRTDSNGVWRWYMNNSTFNGNYSSPVLELANAGKTDFSDQPSWNVYNMGNAKSYRFVSYNPAPGPHPLHLHGHNMYILDIGKGVWNGSIVRPENPLRRDVVMVPGGGYVVWQADADNPGAWAFHCHILWHASLGFGIDILERVDEVKQLEIPGSVQGLCRDWDAFVERSGHEVIDSGL